MMKKPEMTLIAVNEDEYQRFDMIIVFDKLKMIELIQLVDARPLAWKRRV